MHSSAHVNNISLIFTFILVLMALWIGWRQKLGINKDMIIGVVRACVQLIIVGFLLKHVFNINNTFLTMAMILIIIFNAAYNAMKRGDGIPNLFWISFLAIFISTSITLAVLVFLGTIKMIPSQMIPVSGMIASNSMIAVGLVYRNMLTLFRDQRQQVLERLALGGTVYDASIFIIRECIKTGMQPTIDASKTYGIVSLPGMMTGLIFAGVDPVYAIKYQIMVVFMLLSTTSLSSVTACYLAYKQFFNNKQQLINHIN